MRYVVLILALLGVAGSGIIGARWMANLKDTEQTIEFARKQRAEGKPVPNLGIPLEDIDRRERAGYPLIGAAVLAVVGGVLAFMRIRLPAAAVLLAAFVTPLAFYGGGGPAIFTFPLALAALFAFFIRRRPALSAVGDDYADPAPRGRVNRLDDRE